MKYVKLYEDFIAEEEFFKGGVANGMTPEDLAKTHKVSVDVIKAALEKGVNVEVEHTNDKAKAYEIAKDHIFEDPKYYDKLAKIEEFVNESRMPEKFIGNDEIVYLKTKEDSRGAHYNLYYKGHNIETGGVRFGNEKELKSFANDYILSNQWYNKLRYADPNRFQNLL